MHDSMSLKTDPPTHTRTGLKGSSTHLQRKRGEGELRASPVPCVNSQQVHSTGVAAHAHFALRLERLSPSPWGPKYRKLGVCITSSSEQTQILLQKLENSAQAAQGCMQETAFPNPQNLGETHSSYLMHVKII